MKRFFAPFALAATFALALAAPAARAQEEEAAEEEEDVVAQAPQKKQTAAAKEDAAPVSDVVGYKFPRGIYTMSDLGVFWRYLGFADNGGRASQQCFRCRYPTYYTSNAQPFIGFSVGYDILPTVFDYIPNMKLPDIVKRFGVSAQMSVGTGYVANAAPWSIARSAKEGTRTREEESPKDHAILMLHPALAVNFIPPPFERVVLEARVFFGAAAFTPSVQRFERVFADPKWWLGTFGADFGFGLSIKYMTLLTNFVIGSDLALYNLFSPGWGTELFIPPYGRYSKNDPSPQFGVAAGNGKTNIVLPFVWASSFSPIIIKYVF